MHIDVLENIPGMEQARPVKSVLAEELSELEFKREFVGKNRPVLIKNAVKHWPAMTLWKDKAYLKDRCGHTKISMYPHINYTSGARVTPSVIEDNFSAILELLCDNKTEVASAPIHVLEEHGDFSELKGDVGDFSFLKSAANPLGYPPFRCFMYKNASTGWHIHHADETLMCQIKGSKKTALIPPDRKVHNRVKHAFESEDYLDSRSFFNIPEGEGLPVLVADVDEGDAMYIPPFWWHAVNPNDENFGITVVRCWRSPLHIMGDIRFPAVRDMWKKSFRHPGIVTLLVVFYGFLSMSSIVLRRLKRFISGN